MGTGALAVTSSPFIFTSRSHFSAVLTVLLLAIAPATFPPWEELPPHPFPLLDTGVETGVDTGVDVFGGLLLPLVGAGVLTADSFDVFRFSVVAFIFALIHGISGYI